MPKTLEQYFADWEMDAFGFGYGTGECHILPELKKFLFLCDEDEGYDYTILEDSLSPVVAWLLINALCDCHILEYGTSPRYGWLSENGKNLKRFVDSHSAEELCQLACDPKEDYIVCMPDACNCGPNGYVDGVVCPNPFWGKYGRGVTPEEVRNQLKRSNIQG